MFILYASSACDSDQTELHRTAAAEDRHKESTKKNATLTDIVTPNSILAENFSTTTLTLQQLALVPYSRTINNKGAGGEK